MIGRGVRWRNRIFTLLKALGRHVRETWVEVISWWTARRPWTPPSPLAAPRRPSLGFGRVWIDDSGRVRVKNPDRVPGVYPVIVVPDPATGISLTVNGAPVVGPVVVQESDIITLTVQSQPPRHHLSVTVDDPGLQAVLTVEYEAGCRRDILRTDPQWRLILSAKETPVLAPPVSLAEIQAELDRAEVRVGRVPDAVIQPFLDRHQPGSLVIAQGIPASPGTPNRYEALPLPPTIRRTASVEWEEPHYAGLGTIIGLWYPGEPARPGVTVWGTMISPPPLKPHPPTLGPGVAPMDNHAHLVATRAGRVLWTPDRIDIIPEHVHSGSLERQALTFDGDIVVEGSVTRGATVVATGNLIVIGDVEESELVCGGTMRLFGEARQAKLSQGHVPIDADQVLSDLGRIEETLTALGQAIVQVHHHLGHTAYPFPGLLQGLIRTKFQHLFAQVQALKRTVRRLPYRRDPVVRALIESVLPDLDRVLAADLRDQGDWNALKDRVRRHREQFLLDSRRPLPDDDAQIVAGHLSGCWVRSHGPIRIRKASSCDMETAREVEIAGQLVGGVVVAGYGVTAHTLGSPDGIVTMIRVTGPKGRVQSHELFPHTVVDVGSRHWEITQPMTDVIMEA